MQQLTLETTIVPSASGDANVAKVLDVVPDRVQKSAHGVSILETELCTAVENRRSFRADLLVDAEQCDVTWHFDPPFSNVSVASALEATLVADGRNFGLVATSPLILHLRCAIARARALAESVLIASIIAQGERSRLDKRQSIDLVADLRREFSEVTGIRRDDGDVTGRWSLL